MPRKRRKLPWLDERDGIYYAFWYDEPEKRTKRLSLRTDDPEQAATRFAAFLSKGQPVYEGARGDLTCGQALDHYWTEHVLKNAKDQARIGSKIKNLRAHFQHIPVAAVEIPTCREYVEKRHSGAIGDGPAVDGTITGELSCLTAALNHEVKWKRLDKAPYIEKPGGSQPRERWLTHEELAALFAAAEPDLRLWGFCQLAYYTASRRAALQELTWFQTDEKARRIRLNPAGRAQTKKRRPTVPIDPLLAPVLVRLRAAYGKTPYVLGSKQPIWYPFRQVCDSIGLTDVTPHTLRHTRATHLLQAGKSPWAVANLLGDTLQTVIRTYGHPSADHLENELFDAPLTREDLLS
ncbi:MAG: tyrosine-type recombinase/integrase [Alphaproteobacteria bacterium]